MNVNVAKTDDMFREEVRAFLRDNLPKDLVDRTRTAVHPTREDILGFTQILARQGWSVPHWPREYGGPGWTAMQRYIFDAELVAAGTPGTNIQGVGLVGPVVYTFGSEEQKQRFLPPIREGKVFWSQGFSEPNSGSDLASLRTRAVRQGDHYVVNGQKIWNSQSMMADWIFCLVRTNPDVKPQLGISFLLVKIDLPGITVRPIQSIDGGESLCEVFFDNVTVPADGLIGEEGKGWDYAKFLLGNERVATAAVPTNKRNLAMLKDMAQAERKWGRPLADSTDLKSRIARAEVDLLALEAGVLRAIESDNGDPALPSVLKLEGTRLQQEILGLQVEALGSYGAAYYPEPHERAGAYLPGLPHGVDTTAEFLFMRAATIYGGSSEVQRNILSRLLLRGETNGQRALDDDRRLLAESVERFVEKHDAFGHRKTRPPTPETVRATWATFAEMGWLGAALPEEAGGLGGGPADLAIIAEAFGRGLVAEPFLGSAVLAGTVIDQAGGPRKDELLGALIAGETLFAFAHDEPEARGNPAWVTTAARADGDGFVLDGFKCLVLGGTVADRFVVSARTAGGPGDESGLSLFVVDRDAPGVTVKSYRTIDHQPVADVELRGVRVAGDAVLGGVGDGFAAIDTAWATGAVVACADAVGAMDKALWITRDYLKTRKQFGAPLADFQALQHRLADMYVELELARASLGRGLEALALADAKARRTAVSATKARVGRAGFFVGGQGVQLHGGIGMTEEYIIGHYFKRLKVLDTLFGDSHHHVQAYAAAA